MLLSLYIRYPKKWPVYSGAMSQFWNHINLDCWDNQWDIWMLQCWSILVSNKNWPLFGTEEVYFSRPTKINSKFLLHRHNITVLIDLWVIRIDCLQMVLIMSRCFSNFTHSSAFPEKSSVHINVSGGADIDINIFFI